MTQTLPANRLLNQLMVDAIERFWSFTTEETMYARGIFPSSGHEYGPGTVFGCLHDLLRELTPAQMVALLQDERPERPRLFDFVELPFSRNEMLLSCRTAVMRREIEPADVELCILSLLRDGSEGAVALARNMVAEFVSAEFLRALRKSDPALDREDRRRGGKLDWCL